MLFVPVGQSEAQGIIHQQVLLVYTKGQILSYHFWLIGGTTGQHCSWDLRYIIQQRHLWCREEEESTSCRARWRRRRRQRRNNEATCSIQWKTGGRIGIQLGGYQGRLLHSVLATSLLGTSTAWNQRKNTTPSIKLNKRNRDQYLKQNPLFDVNPFMHVFSKISLTI